MKKYLTVLISAASVALMLVGCKPTEKNYQAAYDAAVQKRQQMAAEQMRPATGLLSDDGPQLRVVDGDSIYVLRDRLYNLDGKRIRCKWAVAVGVFKMDTNAKGSVQGMLSKGFKNAQVAKVGGERYYALSDTVPSLEAARKAAGEFKKAFPEYPYVGLPGAPVLIGN